MDMDYINDDGQNDSTSTNTNTITNNDEHVVCNIISSIQNGNYGESYVGSQDYKETAIGSTYFSFRETDIDIDIDTDTVLEDEDNNNIGVDIDIHTGFEEEVEDEENIIGSQVKENIFGNEDGKNAKVDTFGVLVTNTAALGHHMYALTFFIIIGTYIILVDIPRI